MTEPHALDDLLAALHTLTTDLYYPSEEDTPVAVLDLGRAASVADALDREAPGALPMSVEGFFEATRAGGFPSAFPEETARFEKLHALLRAETTELSAHRSGEVIERRLVLGRHPSGHVIGIATSVVFT